MSNKNPNTTNMVNSKKLESQNKKQAVLSALNRLQLLNDPIDNPISKARICQLAGVSKPFLYSYPNELLKPINDAIQQQNNKYRVIQERTAFSENSKDKLIESLKRRINSLQEENKKLKNENAILLGKLSKR